MTQPLRIGLIGVGSVVREIYQHLFYRSDWSSMLDVVAVAEPDDAARAWFCDTFHIPAGRRFTDYREMLSAVELDAVQVNTPDTLHAAPTIAALEAGCDVMVPKPLAASVADGRAMVDAARRTGRLLAVDFHKRSDPRTLAAAQRVRSGALGTYQSSVWFMLDKLLVADPNHAPRFFASPDFAVKNSPLTFLTVHMLDTLLAIAPLVPASVRARAWSQKLPSLQPRGIDGHDMVSTDITFTDGSTTHIVTGWHLPNDAWSITVGEGRLIFTDGLLDLDGTRCGLRDLSHDQGLREPNVLFETFEPGGRVSGFGISHPGRLYEAIRAHRRGEMDPRERERRLSASETGLWVTAAIEAGLRSLEGGERSAGGVIAGIDVPVEPVE